MSGVILCVFMVCGDAPESVLAVDEIYERAMSNILAIESIRVEYEARHKVLREVAGLTEDVEETIWSYSFASKGESRLLRKFPPRTSPYEPRTLLFDGEYTADVRYKFKDSRPEPLMMTVFLRQEKLESVDEEELYCQYVLNLLLTDRARGASDKSTKFPHCLGNEIARRMRGSYVEFRVLPVQEEVDGAWCHVVESHNYQRFWVDTELGCVLRKHERPGHEIAMYRDFVELPEGIWIPRSFTGWFLTADKNATGDTSPSPFLEMKIEVKDIDINSVNDDEFRLAVPAGVDVSDPETGAMRRLPQGVEGGLASLSTTASQHVYDLRWTDRRRLLVVMTLVILVVLALMSLRSWKRTRLADG